MLITPYLLGSAFHPELTDTMSIVLKRVCSELQLRLYNRKHNSKIEVIAGKITGWLSAALQTKPIVIAFSCSAKM